MAKAVNAPADSDTREWVSRMTELATREQGLNSGPDRTFRPSSPNMDKKGSTDVAI
jgi:hypothetical protein